MSEQHNKNSEPGKKMLNLTVDGREISVPEGTNLVNAAYAAGTSVPHFCYHDGLSVAGQCRMCYVEIEGMPKLATACSTVATQGMKVKTEATSQKVKDSQKNTLEFTLLHHPLDCPICDRGGECKLQDYTLDYGPPRSRMDDDKRHAKKHTDISEEIVLDQERCILCTRCVRFSSEVDGRTELVVQGRGSTNKLDVFEGRPMQSPFSGNVVDLCPVGALTADDFRFKARPWEMKSHDGVCSGCAVGCNVTINTLHRHPGIPRPDKSLPQPDIIRLMPRANSNVNTWWMCDKGRWGYHFNNARNKQLHDPMIRPKLGALLESVGISQIQNAFDQEKQWEFLIDDDCSQETVDWALSLAQSWQSRGQKQVQIRNQSGFGAEVLKVWNQLKSNTWNARPSDWSGVRHVVATQSYRELETVAPILSLRLGQSVRKGQIKWSERSAGDFIQPSDDVTKTVYLMSVPRSSADLAMLSKFSAQHKVIILWTRSNSRGLLDSGLCPVEALQDELKSSSPAKNLFVFSQTSQNDKNLHLVTYAGKTTTVALADSFSSALSDKAAIILPLKPFYESENTLTNLEGYRQKAAGVKISHPNYQYLERGGPSVSASLRTL